MADERQVDLLVTGEQWDRLKRMLFAEAVERKRLESELATEKAWAKYCFDGWEELVVSESSGSLDYDIERALWEKASANSGEKTR